MVKGIIFDFGYTLYDPTSKTLYPGALEVLEKLKGKYKLAVASRTDNVVKRHQELHDLEVGKYFDVIEVVPEGTNKDLQSILEKFNLKPEEVMVVGDRLTSEITQGNKLGMKTVHYVNGPEKDRLPANDLEKADFGIINLHDLIAYVNLN